MLLVKWLVPIFLFLHVVLVIQAQSLQIYPVQLPNTAEVGGRVNCIFQDKLGFVWIGKETGLYRYDGYEMKAFRYIQSDTTSISANSVLAITDDSTGNLWIGTKGGGINYYNHTNGRFTRFLHNPKNSKSISYNDVCAIKPVGNGHFWIGTDGGGLNFFDPRTGNFSRFNYLCELRVEHTVRRLLSLPLV